MKTRWVPEWVDTVFLTLLIILWLSSSCIWRREWRKKTCSKLNLSLGKEWICLYFCSFFFSCLLIGDLDPKNKVLITVRNINSLPILIYLYKHSSFEQIRSLMVRRRSLWPVCPLLQSKKIVMTKIKLFIWTVQRILSLPKNFDNSFCETVLRLDCRKKRWAQKTISLKNEDSWTKTNNSGEESSTKVKATSYGH